MKINHVARCVLPLIVAPFLLLASARAAQAGIMGFGNLSDFTINQADTASPPTYSNGVLQLTNGYVNEDRSIFCNAPQSVVQFSASFTFSGTNSWNGTGASLVLQNSASGANAIGNGGYGYGAFPGNSAAIVLDSYDNATAFFTDANSGNGYQSVSPVNLFSSDPIEVNVSYNGSLLNESLLDTVTGATFHTSYLVLTPLTTTLGGSSAYVGISASADNNGFFSGPGVEDFSNFQYAASAVPEPSTLALLGLGAGALCFARRRTARRRCLNAEQRVVPTLVAVEL